MAELGRWFWLQSMVKMVTVSVTGSRRIPVVNSAAKSHSCLYQVIITVKVQCATQRNHLFLIFGCKLLQYCCIVQYSNIVPKAPNLESIYTSLDFVETKWLPWFDGADFNHVRWDLKYPWSAMRRGPKTSAMRRSPKTVALLDWVNNRQLDATADRAHYLQLYYFDNECVVNFFQELERANTQARGR